MQLRWVGLRVQGGEVAGSSVPDGQALDGDGNVRVRGQTADSDVRSTNYLL